MKPTIPSSKDHLNTSLKTQPSSQKPPKSDKPKQPSHYSLNDIKPHTIHTRVKTQQLLPQHTLSTISIFNQKKQKDHYLKKKKYKSYYHKLDHSKNCELQKYAKLYSTCHSTCHQKQSKQLKQAKQNQITKSLQKLRSDIQWNNPQLLAYQLKNIPQHDKKTPLDSSILNQWYLFSSKLIDTMKIMKKKQNTQIAYQRQNYQKRQDKLIKKLILMDIKNQRYTALINQLRIRNIDIDSIWHQQKLNTKIHQLTDLQPN